MPDVWEFPVYTNLPFDLSYQGNSTTVPYDDESTAVSRDDESTSWPGYMELVDAAELHTLRAVASAARELSKPLRRLLKQPCEPEIAASGFALLVALDDLREGEGESYV